MLFRVRDDKQVEKLAEECCLTQFTHEQFTEAFEYATKDSPHDFLLVDYSASKESKILRKDFNRYLTFV
jgi:hypothetical protein